MAIFGKKKTGREDPEELIGRREYKRAAELIEAELRTNPDPRLRLKLGDVVALDGQQARAVREYLAVVDTYTSEGFIAKAVAVCKKVQRIDPENKEVNRKLVELAGPAPAPASAQRAASGGSAPIASRAMDMEEGPELGFDSGFELGFDSRSFGAPPAASPAPAKSAPAAELSFELGTPGDADSVADAALGAIGGAFAGFGEPADLDLSAGIAADLGAAAIDVASLGPAGDDEGRSEEALEVATPFYATEVSEPEEEIGEGTRIRLRRTEPISSTPLFSDLGRDELIEVCRRMELREYAAGQTVVQEGDDGRSLYVIADGSVAVYTRNPHGREVFLARLGEGDFFGEVSVLTEKPRTATIVAEEETSLLELSKDDVDAISEEHPRVREVLENFHKNRVHRTVETMIANLKRGA